MVSAVLLQIRTNHDWNSRFNDSHNFEIQTIWVGNINQTLVNNVDKKHESAKRT